MPEPLSRSQADRLGKRLAEADEPAVEDLELLEQWRSQHEPALAEVEVVLRALGFEPTSRQKTTGTTVDKLKRESVRLSQVDDIAGVRVVVDGTRHDQDGAVARIVERLPDSHVKDRRIDPSHGYRAVHVIAKSSGYRVEVQVRTVLQNLWAQMLERLADQWGRQIRYGLPPDDATNAVTATASRSDVLRIVMLTGDVVDEVETAQLGPPNDTTVGLLDIAAEMPGLLVEIARAFGVEIASEGP